MKIIRQISCIILTIALAAAASVDANHARADLSNYEYTAKYSQGQFSDVSQAQWFSQYVEDAYNYGFITGRSADSFAPGGLLTLGEAVTLAARLNSIYHTGKAEFAETTPYYQAYAEYAIHHKIIANHGDYSRPATRSQLAALMHSALPPEAYPQINTIPDYIINDVVPGSEHGEAIYTLYRAGILSGSDRFGTFHPDQPITRAEVSALLVRVASPGSRLNIKLLEQLPAEIIYQRSVDAVITIETFDTDGKSIRTGSGFIINSAGHVVTALHVIDHAASAAVTLLSGETYPVSGILAASEEFNVVIMSLGTEKSGFGFLNIADSDLVEIGNTVYALGSPLNYSNTISDGIISHTSRELNEQTLIMFTAPISFGSGGGPVLNTRGQVIGIASLSYRAGQNLNLAIPANHIKELTLHPFEQPLNMHDYLESRDG